MKDGARAFLDLRLQNMGWRIAPRNRPAVRFANGMGWKLQPYLPLV